jgi:hypothetical protein
MAWSYKNIDGRADVLFVGLQDAPGHVIAVASPVGRDAVGKIFVGFQIDWGPIQDTELGFPDDWREFVFVLPDIVEYVRANNLPALRLRQNILDIVPVDQMFADDLACLMMFAAEDQGVRAVCGLKPEYKNYLVELSQRYGKSK